MSTTKTVQTLHPEALAPGTQVGSWRVVERLGVGGQGAVYRAEDPEHSGEFYALKLALHAGDARAEREVALMMTRAAHPHVARFHGCARWPHPRDGWLGLVPVRWLGGLALVAVAVLLVLASRAPSVAPETPALEGAWTTEMSGESAAPSDSAPLPAKQQKQAPCIEGLEVELSGVCWHRLWQQPPQCPTQTVAYRSQCLWPVPRPRPVPTSVDGGAP